MLDQNFIDLSKVRVEHLHISTAIKDYMDRHGIKYPEHYLDDALAAKPDFDKMKKLS